MKNNDYSLDNNIEHNDDNDRIKTIVIIGIICFAITIIGCLVKKISTTNKTAIINYSNYIAKEDNKNNTPEWLLNSISLKENERYYFNKDEYLEVISINKSSNTIEIQFGDNIKTRYSQITIDDYVLHKKDSFEFIYETSSNCKITLEEIK